MVTLHIWDIWVATLSLRKRGLGDDICIQQNVCSDTNVQISIAINLWLFFLSSVKFLLIYVRCVDEYLLNEAE